MSMDIFFHLQFVVLFNDRAAALNPVSGIDVRDAVDIGDDWVVNMPAHNAVIPSVFRFFGEAGLKLHHKVDSTLHLLLQECRQTPVSHAHARAKVVEVAIGPEQECIRYVAEECHPLMITNDPVKLIAVDDPETLACHLVLVLIDDMHVAEGFEAFKVGPKEFVVVADNPHNLRALLGLLQDLFDDLVMSVVPVEFGTESPAVDDITDKEEVLTLNGFEEFQ